uniref:Uncharacterized protein LOC105123259 n=2 Tax=Rhizophora mucronata TaxID=61149 RepID=A0A2P2J9H0_RHIMU
MDNMTASEVAGLGVGTLLLCATIAAPKIDAFISASQRRTIIDLNSNLVEVTRCMTKHLYALSTYGTYPRSSLGMCKRCGDLRMIACSKCKGTGLVKAGGPFGFNIMDDLNQSLGGKSKIKSTRCTECQARGRFVCPDCSRGSSI